MDDHPLKSSPRALPPVILQPRQQRGVGHVIKRPSPAPAAGFKPVIIRQHIVSRDDDGGAEGQGLPQSPQPRWQHIQKGICATEETVFVLHMHEIGLEFSGG